MKKILSLAALSFCCWSQADAQSEIQSLIPAGKDMAEISNAYLSPVFKGFGAAMNNGWYNTANVHKSGRFDLSINFHLPIISSSDKTYNVADLDLKTLKHDASSPTTGQTISGSSSGANPVFDLTISRPALAGGDTTIKIPSPAGVSLPVVFAPTAQLGVGIIKGTELIVRYMPTIDIGDRGAIGLWGVGVKHDIKQWIPIADKLPFDLSVLAGYTKFNSSVAIEAKPLDGFDNNSGANYDNQKLNMSISSTTINAIISKKLLFLTVYAGGGYMGSSTNLSLSGNYPIPTFNTTTAQAESTPTDGKVLMNKDYAGANGMNGTAGFRLKFAVVTIGAGYTIAKYSTPTFGLGVCVDFL